MRFEYICENKNLKENLKNLKDMGYKYIVKANDIWLGGTYSPYNRKHIQLIACYDVKELNIVLDDIRRDNTFNYVNWYYTSDYKGIYGATYNKTFTIRNDWSRATGYVERYIESEVNCNE